MSMKASLKQFSLAIFICIFFQASHSHAINIWKFKKLDCWNYKILYSSIDSQYKEEGDLRLCVKRYKPEKSYLKCTYTPEKITTPTKSKNPSTTNISYGKCKSLFTVSNTTHLITKFNNEDCNIPYYIYAHLEPIFKNELQKNNNIKLTILSSETNYKGTKNLDDYRLKTLTYRKVRKHIFTIQCKIDKENLKFLNKKSSSNSETGTLKFASEDFSLLSATYNYIPPITGMIINDKSPIKLFHLEITFIKKEDL